MNNSRGKRSSIPQKRSILTLLSQLCRDPAQRHPGKFPKVPGRRRGTQGFPAAPRERPRESFFNASRGPSPLPQEYWSELPCPPPGDLPNPGIEPGSPALAGQFFSAEPPGIRINGLTIIVNKRIQNAVLGCNLKKDRMISVRFQGKPFKSMPQPVILKKLKLNGSMKTYKTF